MAFTWIQNSQSTDALIVDANFQEVGSGSILPKLINTSGSNATTGVYDLGSVAYKWNNIYANNLDFSGQIGDVMNRIYSVEIPSATSRIEITGLNGDTDYIYELATRFVYANAPANFNYMLHFNGDTSVAYGYQRIRSNTAGVASAFSGSEQGIFLVMASSADTTTSNLYFTHTVIFAKSGHERQTLQNSNAFAAQRYIKWNVFESGIWTNTAATITTMVLSGPTTTAIGVGSTVDLWARR